MDDRSADGRSIEVQRSGGSCLLIGLLFTALPAIFVVMLLRGADVKVNGRHGRPSDAWIPGIMCLGGLALAGLRWRSAIELSEPALVDSYGWYFAGWQRRRALGALQRIEIGGAVQRGSGKNRRTVYPVCLVCADRSHELEAPQSILNARRTAERIARAANLPLHDRSSGGESVRLPDQLDQPYVRRMTDADLAVVPPQAPRAVLGEGDDGIVITVPSFGGAVAGRVVSIIVLLCFPSFVFSSLSPWWWPGVGCLAALTIVGAVGLHRSGLLATRVCAGTSGLRCGRARMTVDEIEELVVASGNGAARLRAISDRRIIEFGAGLADDELRFLRAVVLRAMRGR